ncbi:programmed cell death protein 5 [Tribolium castaneum]|uniref:Programmed cell death protein 5-like Protein n=1 Tax=Tribolium castaneum TaxID=7070 RepID=D6WGR4_TRICA|nr:PREDICTED: programmed cell death protein 5 [Tribolium castaneum]EEZ99607.1 Programmed cell death protein 5-like Protein [Tribolium castaneum]|eukprot:XP_967771.1 PREDICTED: programmed cell death protein 5 [Tribolium castaneum]
MADSDLEELRKQRLAQLQSQYKGDAENENSQKRKEEQARAQEDAKNSILSQILDQPARARLNTLMLGKPDKGKLVENMLIRMAQTGQICSKIGETELITLLENVNAQTQQKKPTVKFDRRRAALDSDEDF